MYFYTVIVIELFTQITKETAQSRIKRGRLKFLYFYTVIVIEIFIRITEVKCIELNEGRYGRGD